MTCRATIIHKDFVAPFTFDRERSFPGVAGWHVAHSRCYVCPACGEVWACQMLDGEPLMWPTAAFCRSHKITTDWCVVPGSILIEEGWGVIDTSLLAAMPPELLAYEFNLHLEAFA
ncbi:MAG: hypothetical protein SFV24_19010 [Gemmatimonadales bacterium]|nr:hypothetical protein [Gemmatimonadales bacterium]